LTELARVGVALGGHWLSLDAVRRIARAAEARGVEALFVDGDDARVASRPAAPLYDPGALCATLLADSERLRVGALRLPGFAAASAVARSLATQQIASAGRALGFFGVGAGRHLESVGLPAWSAKERIAHLDELLDAVRALLAGGEVSRRGSYVRLQCATAPRPEHPLPIVVAAAGRRALELVDRHADVWDANVPPLARHLEPARAYLKRALETSIWVFARPDASLEQSYAAYRRHCPWFPELAPTERERALLWGDPAEWAARLAALCAELEIQLPVLDLSGLDEASALRALSGLRAAATAPMP
jgi:alkanesulfonate monooxygenase SsuD/methylene tetrahydromethanopterin reductase-like flavin-dependent oxidoreductase (luciferase family)